MAANASVLWKRAVTEPSGGGLFCSSGLGHCIRSTRCSVGWTKNGSAMFLLEFRQGHVTHFGGFSATTTTSLLRLSSQRLYVLGVSSTFHKIHPYTRRTYIVSTALFQLTHDTPHSPEPLYSLCPLTGAVVWPERLARSESNSLACPESNPPPRPSIQSRSSPRERPEPIPPAIPTR